MSDFSRNAESDVAHISVDVNLQQEKLLYICQ